MSRPQFETAHYIASSADLPLQDVTSQLEAAFDLPPFNFDGEASGPDPYGGRCPQRAFRALRDGDTLHHVHGSGWVELPRGTYQLR